jgi:hypothetical protein
MDRLLMSQMKIDNIQGVILFPFSANIQWNKIQIQNNEVYNHD